MNIELANVLETTLHLAIGSTIILAMGFATIFACRRQSSATRHLAGVLTCLSLLGLPVAILAFPSWHLGLVPVASIQPISSAKPIVSVSALPHDNTPSPQFVAESQSHESPIRSHAMPRLVYESQTTFPFALSLVGLYLIGVTYGLMRLITDHILARRLKVTSTEFKHDDFDIAADPLCLGRNVLVRASEQVSVPMVTGIVRSLVLLPITASAWPADQVRSAIAHELAHIERRDLAVQTVAKIAAIVYWPQPFVHLLVRAMRSDRESACDDKAVSSGQQHTQYARHLLSVAADLCDRKRDRAGVLAMARISNVEKRIKAVLNGTRRRTPPTKKVTTLMLASILASLFVSAWISPFAEDKSFAAAQQVKNERGGKTFHASGRVIDANGQPLAGAFLTWVGADDELRLMSITKNTNDQGEFEFVYPSNARDFDNFHTWVYAEGHAIRVVMMRDLFRKTNQAKNVAIQLPKSEPTSYRVLLPDGSPCKNAFVSPYSVAVPNGVFAADEPTGLTTTVPDELAERIGRRTNDTGEVSFDSVPLALLRSIVVTTEKHGKQKISATDKELRLHQAGEIRGAVMVENPERFAGTMVFLNTERGIAQVELDAKGEFHVPAIATGQLYLQLIWDDKASVHPIRGGRNSNVVKANETLTLLIDTRPTITLHGQVLFEDTRKPVVGATIYMRNTKSPTHGSHVNTDSQGRYSILVPPGKIHRQVITLGTRESEVSGATDRYDHPRLGELTVSPGAKLVELEPILVPPRVVVRGKLLDSSGNPIDGETVVLHTGSSRHLAGSAETDGGGKFEMAVRDWQRRKDVPLVRRKSYWAVVDKPAVGTRGPVYTRLTTADENPKAMRLIKP